MEELPTLHYSATPSLQPPEDEDDDESEDDWKVSQ
jgi:hypothetical protein